MKSMFRWKGLIAFVVVMAGLIAFFMLFSDSLLQRSIEAAGTRLVGARVELDTTDLSFFPTAVELTRLQVTNPDAPMKNAADIARIAFGFSPAQLLHKKVIINEMAVEGMRFDTDRKTSGAVRQKEKDKEKQATSRFKLPDFDMEDVETILKKESLQSLEKAKQLKQTVNTKKEDFQARLETLPDEETFREYEARIKALRSGDDIADVLSGVGKLNALQKDIRNDIARVREARDDLKDSLSSLRKQAAAVANSPQEDIRRLKEKYALTPQGMGNMAALLFGPKYGKWVETGLTWYQKLQPFLAGHGGDEKKAEPVKPLRGKGVNVPFPDRLPLPDFLVRRAAVSAETSAGIIEGTVNNITTQQHVLGKPLTYSFSSSKMKEMDAIDINGELNHISADHPKDTLKVAAKGIHINDFVISGSQDFPLILSDGTADGSVSAAIASSALDATTTFSVIQADFTSPGKSDLNRVEQAVIKELSRVSRFSLNAAAQGPIDDFRIKIESNINDVIKNTVAAVAEKQVKEFESRLSRAIKEKTDGPIASLQDSLGGLDLIEQELNKRLQQGNRLGEINLESLVK